MIVHPPAAVEGGRISIEGPRVSVNEPRLPQIRIGDIPARVSFVSSQRIVAIVPVGAEPGPRWVRVGTDPDRGILQIAGVLATGLHQVDNPVFDAEGNLYVTYSGTRGQQVPVSIFRVRANGTRETFSSGIVNPTSMAMNPDGRLFVSSRFEGVVYRVGDGGTAEPFATDLGVACGLAFAPDGTLFVGDRSGTIFKVDPNGRAVTFATLPASVAAFHLAYGPPGPKPALYVTGPTFASYDALYRIDMDGTVTTRYAGFGRPQGLGFDRHGTLHVVEALAGVSGLYRVPDQGEPELVVAGPGMVGVAFDPGGGLVITSNDAAYRLS